MKRADFLKKSAVGIGMVAALPAGVVGLAGATSAARLDSLVRQWNDGIIDAAHLWPNASPFINLLSEGKAVPSEPEFRFFGYDVERPK